MQLVQDAKVIRARLESNEYRDPSLWVEIPGESRIGKLLASRWPEEDVEIPGALLCHADGHLTPPRASREEPRSGSSSRAHPPGPGRLVRPEVREWMRGGAGRSRGVSRQEDEEEMIFELLVAGAFALATLRRYQGESSLNLPND
ncbi:hypothetical protein KM043_006565 [Ampulex compressa]|nr:hypothetical protein KM043_006565 [Ampulex compressa]